MALEPTEKEDSAQKQTSQSHLLLIEGITPHEQTFHSNVAEIAYFKAERRGFISGHELDDWLEAEQECHLS